MSQPIGQRDVAGQDLDVFDDLSEMGQAIDRPLVLVQQRDRTDERQILHVVAPGPRLVIEEGQPLSIWVDDMQGTQNRWAF
jgi:hypothetical protein